MYDQCDVDGNECQLFDLLVDYQMDDKAMSLTDQQTSVWSRPVQGADQ